MIGRVVALEGILRGWSLVCAFVCAAADTSSVHRQLPLPCSVGRTKEEELASLFVDNIDTRWLP